MKIGYLHIGPEYSGVRRYGRLIAQEARRLADVEVLEADVKLGENAGQNLAAVREAAGCLAPADVIHIQYNKKVWGSGRAHLHHLTEFARRLHGRVVVTLHDVYAPTFPRTMPRGGGWRRKLGLTLDSSRRAKRFLGGSAAAIIVHSDEEVDRLGRVASKSRLHVIPHFVEQRHDLPDPLAAKNELVLAGKRVVTLLGFILPRKGYGLLLDALPFLPENVDLVFAGGAPVGGDQYVETLRRRIDEQGLAGRVRVTGYLSETDLERYLSATDLAVCPFEGLSASGSLATWISAAKPILASDLPQFRAYNRFECGAINTFSPHTAGALAEAIDRILPTCGLAEQTAVVRVRDRLSMPRILERYRAVYEMVASARGPTELSICSDIHGFAEGLTPKMRVAFLPLWLGNPYQERLGHALALRGVRMRRLGRTASSIVARFLLDRPGILHLHWLHPFHEARHRLASVVKLLSSIFGLMALRMLGVKIIWTAHNLKHHEGKNALLDRVLTRLVVRISHAIIAHCSSAKRQIVEEFRVARPERVHVIPHGNYCDAYENVIDQRAARKRLGIPEEFTVFLFLGQVRPYKGVLEMVEAFRAMDSPDVMLIIAGKPLSEDTANVIRERIDSDMRIRFVSGFVPDEDIQIYMNGSDIVVLPYRNIFTSGAAVLAMSFGRACIAPRMGCMIDWFAKGGAYLYDAEDESGLKHSMETAIKCRDDLPEMGKRNATLAEAWSWERVARDTLRVYRSVSVRATDPSLAEPGK